MYKNTVIIGLFCQGGNAMITKVARSIVLGHNLFDPEKAVSGYVDLDRLIQNGNQFVTSEYIPVEAGDVITFGPAIVTQGYHLVCYNELHESYHNVGIHTGIIIKQHLTDDACIMQYMVGREISYIRMICETRYANEFLVTKNQEFIPEDYYAIVENTSGKWACSRKEQNQGEWTVIANVQGNGIMMIGEQTVNFCPGTLVCVPPGVAYEKTADNGFFDVFLHSTHCLPGTFTGNKPLVMQDDKNKSVVSLLQLMLQVFWEPDRKEHLLHQLYHAVEQILLYRMEKEQPSNKEVSRMVSTIQMSFTTPTFSVEELLATGHYSASQLRRLFKQKMGCTPKEYLLDLRLDYAKKLLRENNHGQVAVSQISHMSGFSDHCYFCRLFKQKVGVTPGEYRKSNSKLL